MALLLLVAGACAQPVVSGRGWMAATETEDIGVQINAVYAALPPLGGVIESILPAPCDADLFLYARQTRPAGGEPGDIVTLTYTGSGTVLAFDYGMGHRMGHGIRDLTLISSENSPATGQHRRVYGFNDLSENVTGNRFWVVSIRVARM